MATLYNAKAEIDRDGQQAYRITKFVDGNVESSYLATRDRCNCPAGQRPTCRHRQMLPSMLRHDMINQPWFIDWDGRREGQLLDFQGHPVTREALGQRPKSSLRPRPQLTFDLTPTLPAIPSRAWRRI